MAKRWFFVGWLVLTVLVLVACESSPSSPEQLANANKMNVEAIAVQTRTALDVKVTNAKVDNDTKIAAANAELLNQQAQNEKLLTDHKVVGEKALNDATVDGQRRRDIIASNTAVMAAYNAAYAARVQQNIAILQDNLNRQALENSRYASLSFVAAFYPWLLAVLVALGSQFVISVGQYWYARIHAGEPRWREPSALERLSAGLFGTPYVRALEVAPGIVLAWITEKVKHPPMWQTRPLHSPKVEEQVARLAMGSKMVQTALTSARGVPDASRVITTAGENVVALMQTEKPLWPKEED